MHLAIALFACLAVVSGKKNHFICNNLISTIFLKFWYKFRFSKCFVINMKFNYLYMTIKLLHSH